MGAQSRVQTAVEACLLVKIGVRMRVRLTFRGSTRGKDERQFMQIRMSQRCGEEVTFCL